MKERDPTIEDLQTILQGEIKFDGYSSDVSDTGAGRDYDLDFKVEVAGKHYLIHTSWITIIEFEDGDDPDNY